jgi:hypothetical protein
MNEQQLSVSSGQLAVISDRSAVSAVEEDPTPMQKIWQPVAELSAAHMQAFADLQSAMIKQDIEAATKARNCIAEIEAEQRQVHNAVRAYLLHKAQQHG